MRCRVINEFSVKLKPSNNYARYIFWTLLFLTAVASVFYLAADKYKGLLGLLVLAIVTAALYVYTKYLSAQYYYDLTTDHGTPVFVVRQSVGKRETTLCRTELYGIRKIEAETAKQRFEHKTPAGYKKYVYLPTVLPKQTYRITTVTAYEKAEIVVEINDKLASLLLEYAEYARSTLDIDEE